MKMSASFQDNREMPCVADDRKCSPPAVENTGYASGNFKDILRDIAVFILVSQFFAQIAHKVISFFTDFPELKSCDGRQNDQQPSDQIANGHMSEISSNASTLSEEESTNTLVADREIVARALFTLSDDSGNIRLSTSSGIVSGSDSQDERLTQLLNRTKVNSTHSCIQCPDEPILTLPYYYCYMF